MISKEEALAAHLAYTTKFEALVKVYQAQVDAYRRNMQDNLNGVNMKVNITKGPMVMKSIIVVYEVSNGYMAVVNDDPDNGTVVATELTEVVNAATNLFAQRKLEQREKSVEQEQAYARSSLLDLVRYGQTLTMPKLPPIPIPDAPDWGFPPAKSKPLLPLSFMDKLRWLTKS